MFNLGYFYILLLNLIIYNSYSIKFRAESNVNPRITPFKANEIIDVSETWLNETIKKSIPVYEGFKEIGGNEPFVIRNSSVEMLNPLNDYYDPIATSSIKIRKFNKKHNVSTVFEDLYHIGSKQNVNIPLVGRKNDIYSGYWFSGDKKWFTPMHDDIDNVFNILVCNSGKKVIFMWDPSKKENLSLKGIGSRTIIPYVFHNITQKQYQHVSNIERFVVVLNARDILYVPKNFIHTVYTWENTFCKSHWISPEKYKKKYEPYKKTSFMNLNFFNPPDQYDEEEINSCRNELFPSANNHITQFEIDVLQKNEMIHKDNENFENNDLWWFKYLDEISVALWNNQLVEIPNAFQNPSRFDLDTNNGWVAQSSPNNVDFERHVLNDCVQADEFVKELNNYQTIFEDLILNHMTISGGNFKCTKYIENDYLETHTDMTNNRILSFVYHNTKKWNKNCGGELIFEGGFGQKIIYPSYNTLYLMIPSERSQHRIRDVTCGSRYSISGWGHINEKGLALKMMEKIRDSKMKHIFKNYFKVM